MLAMPRPWAVHDTHTGVVVGFTMISDNIPDPSMTTSSARTSCGSC